MEFIAPIPFQDAIDKLGEQSVVGSTFLSSEWSDAPVELRDNAFFSSRVESAQFLQRAKDSLGDFLEGAQTKANNGETMLATGSRAAFVSQMQDFLAGEGVVRTTGGLTDIAAEKRLGLVFDVKTRSAQDFGYWKQGMDPDVLNEFPAQRFIRVREVKTERESHIPFEDQVYLKTDPIWQLQINQDFGVPWGPWGWGCGHDVEDVDRDEAEKLHLIKPGEVLKPLPRSLNNNLQASVKNLDPDLVTKLKKEFGDRIKIEGDMMQWVPQPARAIETETGILPVPLPARSNPVSDALTVRVYGDLKQQVQKALAAIDEVHDDGTLPEIPLQNTRRNYLGYFQPQRSPDGLTALYVAVRSDGGWPALTTVHEVGHFLDLDALGVKGRYATLSGDALMREVLAAADDTAAIQALRERYGRLHDGESEYLLKPQEIWARAYAQFVATRSTSPLLKQQLDKALHDAPDRQWTADDFAPVAKAIEAMFTKLGWI